MPFLGWGTGFLDFDNDGWKDLFVANGHLYPSVDQNRWGTSYKQRPLLFRNLGGKQFELVPAVAGSGLAQNLNARGVAFGDLFNNGKIDIVINQLEGPPVLLRNVNADKNHWLGVRLIGSGTKSPRDATGAKVFLTANGMRQRADVISGGSFLSNNDPRLHFGLGTATSVDKLEIEWPSGARETAGAQDHRHLRNRGRRQGPCERQNRVSRKPAINAWMKIGWAAALAATALWPSNASAQDRSPGVAPHASASGYDFHFGPNPFLPSQAKLDAGGFLSPSDFASAEWCGKCHTDIYRQWRESAHANSFREPFYVKNVNLLIDSKGIEYTRHCEGCHNPDRAVHRRPDQGLEDRPFLRPGRDHLHGVPLHRQDPEHFRYRQLRDGTPRGHAQCRRQAPLWRGLL